MITLPLDATNYTIINITEKDSYTIKLFSTITNVNGSELKSEVVVISHQNPARNFIGKITINMCDVKFC